MFICLLFEGGILLYFLNLITSHFTLANMYLIPICENKIKYLHPGDCYSMISLLAYFSDRDSFTCDFCKVSFTFSK